MQIIYSFRDEDAGRHVGGPANAMISPMEEGRLQPVVTLILYAYEEERYIREAIRSVLAQTYSPLEIVLSDDGSADRTFPIMQEEAAAYRGPHSIILNRNPQNIGIGSQVNAAWQKGSGELIVLANGDDVSLPQRVERIVEAWRAGNGNVAAIASSYEVMKSDGTRTGEVVRASRDFSDLAAATYRRFCRARRHVAVRFQAMLRALRRVGCQPVAGRRDR